MTPRIVTLTLNPCLDLAAEAEHVWPTHKVRTDHEHTDPGGGGVNVSRVVHVLGGDTLAVMLTGGAPGRVLNELIDDGGVAHRSIPVAGRTRISLNVLDRSSGLEYRFVPEGPTVSAVEWETVLGVLSEIDADWLIASGSLPNGLPVDAYAQVAQLAARRGHRFVLDTHGKPLRAALHHGITLLKPSLGELEGLLGRKLPDPRMQEAEAMALVREGAADMVAVSLGEDGALLATRDGVLRMASPPIRVQTAVGAGDSFLGAMVLAMAQKRSAEEALRWGMAAGAAAIVCGGTARLTRTEFEARYEALEKEHCITHVYRDPEAVLAAMG
jgi:6-phosphofructokinase 2